jgi:hypothetical protein
LAYRQTKETVEMKKMIFMLVLGVMICLPRMSYSHYRPEQYALAQTQLEPLISELSLHIKTLEDITTDWQNTLSTMSNKSDVCGMLATLEVVQHHSMRAWYNRLLLQNLSQIREGVNLDQMSAILRLSIKPLSNGIHQLNTLCTETAEETERPLCDDAKKTMRSILTVYKEAIAILRSAIRCIQETKE